MAETHPPLVNTGPHVYWTVVNHREALRILIDDKKDELAGSWDMTTESLVNLSSEENKCPFLALPAACFART